MARLLVEHLFDVVLISAAALHLFLLPTLALPAVVLGHSLMGLVGDNPRLLVAKGIIISANSIITSTTLAFGLDALLGILGLLLLVHAEPNPGRPRQRLAEPALGRSQPLWLLTRRLGHGVVVGQLAAVVVWIVRSARVVPDMVLVVVGPPGIEGLGGLRLLRLRILRILRMRPIVVPLPTKLRLLRILLLRLLMLRCVCWWSSGISVTAAAGIGI